MLMSIEKSSSSVLNLLRDYKSESELANEINEHFSKAFILKLVLYQSSIHITLMNNMLNVLFLHLMLYKK